MSIWSAIFGGSKATPVNKDLLTKEMNDLTSAEAYCDTYHGELKNKIRPFIETLEKNALKGKKLSKNDVSALNDYDLLIHSSAEKFALLRDKLNSDSKLSNLKDDRYFRLAKTYVDDLSKDHNNVGRLSTISNEAAASELAVTFKATLQKIDANLEIIEGIKSNLKKVGSEVKSEIKKAA